MANMFSDKTEKQIPKTLKECIQPDVTVTNLHQWAERLENWGNLVFAVLVIIGVGVGIVSAIEAAEIEKSGTIAATFLVVLKWAAYAFAAYCAYHALALLIGALASITQNTMISANVALYEAGKNCEETEQKQAPVESVKTEIVPKRREDSEIVCPACNTAQGGGRKTCANCGQELLVKERKETSGGGFYCGPLKKTEK